MSYSRRHWRRKEVLRVLKATPVFTKQHFSGERPSTRAEEMKVNNQIGAAAFCSVRFCLHRSEERGRVL